MLEFIAHHFSTEFCELNELPAGQISFNLLWTLYPPHALLLGTDDLGQDRVLRVTSSSYSKEEDGSMIFVVNTEYADYNGKHIGFVRSHHSDIRIQEFRGITSLRDLAAAPLALHPSYKTIRAELIARGEMILNLHGRHLQEYKGAALGPRDGVGKRIKFNVSLFANIHPDVRDPGYDI
jgi:hypothetical protein